MVLINLKAAAVAAKFRELFYLLDLERVVRDPAAALSGSQTKAPALPGDSY